MENAKDMAVVKRKLEQLAVQIAKGDIGTADYWGGADVVISPAEPSSREPSFYPEPRRVVTASASELSWLFFRLQDIFSP